MLITLTWEYMANSENTSQNKKKNKIKKKLQLKCDRIDGSLSNWLSRAKNL